MIEIICGKEEEKKDMPFRELPKNVRQIGDTKEKRKIYIEDFVITYLGRLAKPDQAYARGALLLGDIFQTPEGIAVFISGAIEAQNLELDMDETIFDDAVWDKLLKERDRQFPGKAVVGWFLSRIGFSVEMNQKIIKAHFMYFPGNHKVLYMMDSLENEDAFYISENRQLLRQKGYYIYYEKNSAMQEYMALDKGGTPRKEERDIRQDQIRRDKKVVRHYRRMSQYGKQNKKQRLEIRFTRAASMVIIIATLGYALYEMQMGQWADTNVQQTVAQTMAELRSFVGGGSEKGDLVTTAVESGHDLGAGSAEDGQAAEDGEASGKDSGEEKEGAVKSGDEKAGNGDGEEGDKSRSDNKTSKEKAESKKSDQESGKEKNGKEESKDSSDKEDGKEKSGSKKSGSEEDKEKKDKAVETQGKPLYYTVRKGDTLAAISRKMYTTARYASQIARANDLENENEIYIGQKILIPAIQ